MSSAPTDVAETKRRLAQAARIGEVIERVGGVLRAATITGVGRTTLFKWRKGDARPPLDEVTVLAGAAGVSVDWVATGREFSPRAETAEVLWLPVLNQDRGDEAVPVPRIGIEGRVTAIAAAAAFVVEGREMEPFILARDIVIVDRGDRDISRAGGRVYVFRRDNRLALARAFALSQGIVEVYNEVPRAPRERIPASDLPNLDVVGRVALTLSEP